MVLSKKDQSFILLIIAVLVVFYSIYSLFSHLFSTATFHKSDVGKVFVSQDVSKDEKNWFNTSRPLEVSDLKDRVILLHFWKYDCLKCEHVLSEVERLERKFGERLTVIGVHSKKSKGNESNKIIKSILKHDIIYPVINDPQLVIRNSFNLQTTPSLVLLNHRGLVEKTYSSEKEIFDVAGDIEHIISKFKYKISRKPLPLFFEKNSAARNVLRFPSKLEYIKEFEHQSRKIPAIFIANSGNNNIVVTNLLGEIILKIGNKIGGFKDGSFEEASFNSPHAIAYHDKKLYVSDTGNNALREIDFTNNKVTTLIGSGDRGELFAKSTVSSEDVDLSYPGDIEIAADKEHLIIANAGTNQLLKYHIKNKTIAAIAGDGSRGGKDGVYPHNSLSQVSDIVVYDKKIYLTDLKLASLRVLDESGELKTIINGKKDLSLSKPMGLAVDDTGIYIADIGSKNIKKYNPKSGEIVNFIGTKEENSQTKIAIQFDEPNGIIPVLNRFYISDSSNNSISSVNRGDLEAELINVMPPLKLSKDGFMQYLPNLQKVDKLTVAADENITLKINPKKGWKINEKGPSFINLLELKDDNRANLLANFDWNTILEDNIKVSKLRSGKEYTLQGVIYYCEDKENALCYVKSYEQKIDAKKGEEVKEILIKLDY